MKLKAINNYCILEMLEIPELKVSGLFLPGNMEKTQRWGKVVSVGPGVHDLNGELVVPDVAEGDIVYVTSHGQFEVHKNTLGENDKLCLASILDIMAIKDGLNLKPLGNYIQIEKLEVSEVNEHGIAVPHVREAPSNVGVVVALGKGWKAFNGAPLPFQVKVGDKVVYQPLRTMVVDLTTLGIDEKKTLIQHADILGVIEEE